MLQPQRGLLNQARQQQGQGSQYGTQATPEEQQMLEQAFEYATRFLYSDAMRDRVEELFRQNSNTPVRALAQLLALAIVRTEKKMQLPDDIKMALGENLVPEIVAFAVEVGLVKEEQANEEFFSRLATATVEEYALMREQMGEPLDPESAAQNVNEMQAEGTLTEGINAMSNEAAGGIREILSMAGGQ